MGLVLHDKSKTEAEALLGSKDTIYFTTDTNNIVMDGKIFGIGPSRLFIGTEDEYFAAVASKQIPYGTIVIIEEPDLPTTAETTAILGLAVLGKMILGQE